MNKICGYSCEHNKGGVCQIPVCDKKLIMSDKTEVQMPTRYIDAAITEFQQNKQLQERIKHLDEVNCKLRRKIGRLENNWNKLRKYLIKEQARIVLENTDEDEFVYTDLLNKMKEIKQER
jgi:hypothetical protein